MSKTVQYEGNTQENYFWHNSIARARRQQESREKRMTNTRKLRPYNSLQESLQASNTGNTLPNPFKKKGKVGKSRTKLANHFRSILVFQSAYGKCIILKHLNAFIFGLRNFLKEDNFLKCSLRSIIWFSHLYFKFFQKYLIGSV